MSERAPVGLPLPEHVVEQELDHVAARRDRAGVPPAAATKAAPPLDQGVDSYVRALTGLFARAHRDKPFGLAFSGGGIRSATFNLGILQALAERNLLKYVDYLSTVSGGGYIGSWLHGVIHHDPCDGSVSAATTLLSPRDTPVPGPPHEDPVSFLRKYSNYLAPRPGLFTADTWVIVAIWIRNVLLNQLILVPTVAALVLMVLMGGFAQQMLDGWLAYRPDGKAEPWIGRLLGAGFLPESIRGWLRAEPPRMIEVIAFGLATLALLWALRIVFHNLRRVVYQTFAADATGKPAGTANLPDDGRKRFELQSLYVVPLVFLAGAFIGCATRPTETSRRALVLGIVFAILLAIFQLGGGFISAFTRRHKGGAMLAWLHLAWMVPVTAAVTTGLMWAWPYLLHIAPTFDAFGHISPWLTIAFAPPLVCLSFVVGVGLLVGLMGADYPDAAREWIARVGAMIALLSAAWMAVFLLAVFGPWVVAAAIEKYTATAVTALGGWVAVVAGGVMAGRSARTNGTGAEPSATARALALVTGLAPTLFMIGYLVLIAAGVHAALPTPPQGPASDRKVSPQTTYDVDVAGPQGPSKIRVDVRPTPPPGWVSGVVSRAAGFASPYWSVLDKDNAAFDEPYWKAVSLGGRRSVGFVVLLVACVVVTVVASSRINVNEFSIHDFYKNRLVRCYLGASNGLLRKPNHLTGFDPSDDFPMAELVPERGYQGPYAIVNAALNLNAGSELATQERKAASFVFTPRICGFAPSVTKEDREAMGHDGLDEEGYRPTAGYSHPKGPSLGTALAISGAAANPNMGYHTSGPMAFLLTVFDVRLGWWLGNPRREHESTYPGPVIAWRYLIAELLGQTTARSKFVNLSDGGHFDNIGLYELVRRRCRYVIVGDGEADPGLTFGSLGGAIRKCRADFGVEIDIDPRPIYLTSGCSTAHCVMGTIIYPDLEPDDNGGWRQARGYLFYLKASITGDEPADVAEYKSQYPDFPHQSTADQFFSESQFESYRRLGLHVARDAFEGVLKPGSEPVNLLSTFERLDDKWYAPIPVSAERASALGNDYVELMTSLGANAALRPFFNELAGRRRRGAEPVAEPLEGETMTAVLAVLQLMQNVFCEFRLEHPANQANPRNSGWMRVFDAWAASPTLRRAWDDVQDDYNEMFQQFMKGLRAGDPAARSWSNRVTRF